MRCYVRNFFQEDAISGERFLLAPLLQYVRVPDDGEMKVYTNFVKSLPVLDDPTCFGQHSNADISAQINDTNILLDVLSDFQQVKRLKRDDPSALHVFLLQEIVRYNNHLQRMSSNLKDVQKGTKGLVVMSAELDEIVGCVVIGKIPPSWNKCFPSLKPLANWLRDLMTRVTSLREWGEGDYPMVIWMSGFSYPTGFLTAILHTTARANAVSVDMLSWEFTTMQTQAKDISKAPKVGAYIHCMFLEGAAWDMENMCLEDQRAMELIVSMPVVHFRSVEVKKKVVKGINSCPVYMYPIRTGSRERPSYTISVDLKTDGHDTDFWICRGAAILLSLSS